MKGKDGIPLHLLCFWQSDMINRILYVNLHTDFHLVPKNKSNLSVYSGKAYVQYWVVIQMNTFYLEVDHGTIVD